MSYCSSRRRAWALATVAITAAGLSAGPTRASELIVTNGGSTDVAAGTVTDGASVGINHNDTYLHPDRQPNGSLNLVEDADWTNYGDLWVNSTFNAFTSASGSASVTLSAGSSFYNNGNTRIGQNNWSPSYPTGNMDVAAGATFYSHGQVYVQRGTLTIEGTVTNDSSQWSFVGGNQTGSAVATVQGAAAQWNSTVQVSTSAGTAQLNILGGGTVSGDYGFIGSGSSSIETGAVTVEGDAGAGLTSTWNAGSYIAVGDYSGNGTLTVNDHGRVNTARMFVGHGGSGAQGLITVNTGGVVAVTPSFFPATVEMWAGSTIDLTGGGKMVIGNGTPDAVGDGTLLVANNGVLKGEGTIQGNVVVTGGGRITPGHSPGTITINGDLNVESTGGLTLEIAGTGAGQFDVVNVLGAANFDGGQLSIVFVDGYAPGAGDQLNLTLFTSTGGLSGTFSSVDVQGLSDGLAADVNLDQLSSGQVSMSVTEAVPEPGSIAGLLLAAGLGVRRRR